MERRSFLGLSGVLPVLSSGAGAAPSASSPEANGGAYPEGRVHTPNGRSLEWQSKGDIKVGHLVAGVVDHEFTPGLRAECWGYNGSTPGPTIEATEGDRVRIYVTNRLPEPTSVHWHGMILENGMDGVAGLNQPPIEPGETFVYEFVCRRAGTYMYHPHYDEMTQMALGMNGMFIVHPKKPKGKPVDYDFAMMTHEWKIPVGAKRPDPSAMNDFNVLTFNSKSFPGTEPLIVERGKRVRIRFGNLSPMDHHPIHFHGLTFRLTATDGGDVPESAQHPDTTVLVPVGTTRVIEFVPEEVGDWAFHCHMTHHVMTQMGHGLPNLVGANAKTIRQAIGKVLPRTMIMGTNGMGGMGEMEMPIPENSLPMKGAMGPHGYIDMGGMFTILKVRERSNLGQKWFAHPQGTQARRATAAELQSDQIDAPAPPDSK
jgi:manganese oxidase